MDKDLATCYVVERSALQLRYQVRSGIRTLMPHPTVPQRERDGVGRPIAQPEPDRLPCYERAISVASEPHQCRRLDASMAGWQSAFGELYRIGARESIYLIDLADRLCVTKS